MLLIVAQEGESRCTENRPIRGGFLSTPDKRSEFSPKWSPKSGNN